MAIRTSIFEDEVYQFYQTHHVKQAGVIGNDVTIAGKLPHVDAVASLSEDSCQMTVVLINGVKGEVTTVAIDNVTDTKITLTEAMVTSDVIEVFLPTTTGTLPGNATTGKLSLPQMQNMQAYGATGNTISRPTCGSKEKRQITFAADGTITLGLDRYGNSAMKDFAAAEDDDDVWLLIRVKDVSEGETGADVKYDLLRQVQITGYGRSGQAVVTERGIVTDSITASFVPPVKYIDGR